MTVLPKELKEVIRRRKIKLNEECENIKGYGYYWYEGSGDSKYESHRTYSSFRYKKKEYSKKAIRSHRTGWMALGGGAFRKLRHKAAR